MSRRTAVTLLCGAFGSCFIPHLSAQTDSPRLPFTVRDSIEMRTFSDPFTRSQGVTAKEAPDGRGFVVVTTQGHLHSNTLESILWYFDAKSLAGFVERGTGAPRPQLLYRKVGVPEAEQLNSYGSLITDVQWSPDSRSLLFRAEVEHGKHRLFRTLLSDHRCIDLTGGAKSDVGPAVTRSGTTAYLVSPSQPDSHPKRYSPSVVLNGQNLVNILFPQEYSTTPMLGEAWKLRVHFHGRTMIYPSSPDIFFPYGAAHAFLPSISPGGSLVVMAMPVATIPNSWTVYHAENEAFKFVPSNEHSERSGRDLGWPWQYAIADLNTGKVEPIVTSPTAFGRGYYASRYQAQWSHTGAAILFTSTFLPVAEATPHADNSIGPCAIAEYSLVTHTTSCLAATPPPEQDEVLMSLEYDASDNVVSHWILRGKSTSRIYDRAARTWRPTPELTERADRLQLYIRQEMDAAPTLWVKKGTKDRLLWELNPQLRRFQLGKASLFQWKDSSGYTWRGGLVVPPTPPPPSGYPLVIQTHGFFNEHEFLVDGAFTTASAAQPLACAGIAVLQIEDHAGRHAHPAEEAEEEIRGIKSAIESLMGERLIDRSRIGIEGFSRTSWYVEKALEKDPDLYKAAVLSDGTDQSYVSDVLYVPGTLPYYRKGKEAVIGAPPYGAGLSKWLENAAGFNLDKVTAAVRVEAIGLASVLGEWETYSILQQQGKPVDLVEIPHGQHVLQRPQERYASQQGAVDWFRFWLQGYMREDKETSNENQRWSELRRNAQQ